MKAPPNIPAKGDKCTRRSTDPAIGVVVSISSSDNSWCRVAWPGWADLQMCHLWELKKI